MYDVFGIIEQEFKNLPRSSRLTISKTLESLKLAFLLRAKKDPILKEFIKRMDNDGAYFQFVDPKDSYFGSIVRTSVNFKSLFEHNRTVKTGVSTISKNGYETMMIFKFNNTGNFREINHLGHDSITEFDSSRKLMFLPGYSGPTKHVTTTSRGKFLNFFDMMGKVVEEGNCVVFTPFSKKMRMGVVEIIDPDTGIYVRYDGESRVMHMRVSKSDHILVLDEETIDRAVISKLTNG